MSILLLLCLFGLSAAQVHNPNPEVLCYQCGGANHPFPDCLNSDNRCHHGQNCLVKYSSVDPTNPELKCEHECHGGSTVVTQDCPAGGGGLHGKDCNLCCFDDECVIAAVNQINDLITISAANQQDQVVCPHECHDNQDVTQCFEAGHRCHAGQYCTVTKEHNGNIQGKCQNIDHLQHCEGELQKVCDHGHNCVLGCCTDSQCVSTIFGVPTTTPPTTTTASEGGFGSLNCDDFAGLDCLSLASICPKVDCPDICAPCNDPTPTSLLTTVEPEIPGNETEQPPASTQLPTTVEEAGTTNAPIGTTIEDMGTTNSPIGTTIAEAGTTKAPIGTTMEQDGTTIAPMGTTMEQDGTTIAPMGTTIEQDGTTKFPIGTTIEQDGTTIAPIGTTIEEAVTTHAPIGTTLGQDGTTIAVTNTATAQAGTNEVKANSPSTDSGACQDTMIGSTCADMDAVCDSPVLARYCQKFCNSC